VAGAFLPVDLRGARVVVTAGGAGIGRTIAEAFAGAGARVLVCDVSAEALGDARRAVPGLAAVRASWVASTCSSTTRASPGRPRASRT
jgi:NAD(P)-dependent dehydrogenase (short-subunit alcohol dehydrogenase family)